MQFRDPFRFVQTPEPIKEEKVVQGCYLPKSLYHALSVLALIKGESKSKFILRLLKSVEYAADEDAIIVLANTATAEWQANKTKPPFDRTVQKQRFQQFKRFCAASLRKRGIRRDMVVSICDKIKE